MSHLLIRADASPAIGTGHVMRCLALAEPWLAAGSKVTLLTSKLAPALRSRAETLGLVVSELESGPGTMDDVWETVTFACSVKAAWVVTDGYHLNPQLERALMDGGLRHLSVEDTPSDRQTWAAFLLNQNLGAAADWYPKRHAATQLLLGPRYVQLRREFSHAAGSPRKPSDAALPRILVTLGGSDADNVTGKVVTALSQMPTVESTVVVGASNPHFEHLKSQIADLKCELVRDASNMPALMAKADLAIAASGTTAWELCHLGVPMLTLALADNQRSNAGQLAAAGAARNLGWHADITPEQIAREARALLDDPSALRDMSGRGQTLVDGLGTFRVWLHLNEVTLNLRPATAEDCRRVWEWANERGTRAVSFSSDPIPWEDHVAWYNSRLEDANLRLWIAERSVSADGPLKPIGQVRFDLSGKAATISVSLDPGQRGRNRGTLLIWAACRKLARDAGAQTVIAYIKPDNAASVRAFEKAGFVKAGETTMKGHRALRYEWQAKDADA